MCGNPLKQAIRMESRVIGRKVHKIYTLSYKLLMNFSSLGKNIE